VSAVVVVVVVSRVRGRRALAVAFLLLSSLSHEICALS